MANLMMAARMGAAGAWMLCVAALALGSFAVPVRAQEASPPLCLSLQERAELTDLMARYAIYADAGAGEAFASTFTPEGELVIRDQVVRGQAALAGMINRKTSRTLHLPSAPVLVKMAERTVRARSQLLFMREGMGAGGAPASTAGESGFAVYEDVIVKTDQGWKFQRRRAAEVQALAPEFLPEHPAPVCNDKP